MKNSIIIGIAGGSASGKTSISRQVYEFFKGSHTTCIIRNRFATIILLFAIG